MTPGWLYSSQHLGRLNASGSTKPSETTDRPDPADCGLCGRGFATAEAAELHVLEHFGWTACAACGETMPDAEFRRHRKTRHTDRIHLCACGAAFKTRYRLTDHVAEAHTGPWYGCAVCLSVFKKWSTLVDHCPGGVCGKLGKTSAGAAI